MADVEEYFPRGGKKPATTTFVQSSNFLGTAEKKEKKKRKDKKKKSEEDDGYLSEERGQDEDKISYKTCGLWLSYKVVKEDFLMLGRVAQVKDTKLSVSLPSRLFGDVMACHISEPYNKQLEAFVEDKIDKITDLSKMFKPGQYVCVKALEARDQSLMLTMMPQHINSTRKHGDLHKGALLQVAVSSVEDHGYIMETGIQSTTAFLPKKSANADVEYDVGMVIWCSVKSIQQSPDNSVLTLTNETATLQKAFQRIPTTTLQPGTAVDFIVDKALDNGIEGCIFGDRVSYIQRHHIDTKKKPALGAKIRARLLYTLSPTNVPFLTMKDIFDPTCMDIGQEQQYKEGAIVEEAQVLKILGRCVYFKLSPGNTGILSIRSLKLQEDLTDEEVLAKSYSIGSTHKVRVMCYHFLDRVYSVTDQPNILHEKYFSLTQLSVGEMVSATITSVTDTYLKATIGRIQGFVHQTHMTDAGIFIDPKKASTSKLPKKKFKVGQEVKARVLNLDHLKHSAVLTLKPTLLSKDTLVLLKFEDAVAGKAFTGVVSYIREYLLVTFFDNIKAIIPRKFVSKDPSENTKDSFHLGQLVTCVILFVNSEEKKIVASLTHVPFDPETKNNKRKQESHDNETSSKKPKMSINDDRSDEIVDDDNTKAKKEKKKHQDQPVVTEVIDSAIKAESGKDKKKNKTVKERKTEESEEITDNREDIKQKINQRYLYLIELSICTSRDELTRRITELLKFVNKKARYLDTIVNEINTLEDQGLSPKNKKQHTDLHIERLKIEEEMTKLLDTVKSAQQMLRDSKTEDQNIEDDKISDEKIENVESEIVKDKKEKKQKIKEVKVLDKLEPVIEVPSAKDFWSVEKPVENKIQAKESSSSEDEEEEKPKKKRKKLTSSEKATKAREEEERIREMEKKAIESENEPRSVEQFQRALLASPDCSQLWIAFMAFHLQSTEIERARGVARKALTTINFREEQERLNVWIALLNLEHRFGTKETQQKTLEDALQMNDKYQVHSKLLEILVDTSKYQELAQLCDLMQRKYRQQVEMYTACGGACYKAGLLDKARQLMQKGMTALEKKQHVPLLVQFAQLERTAGERERAEALFEQVLAVYPARVDVCCAYVDMLLKTGDVTRIRQVLERMTAHKLPARKMKVLFKKWIEVEEKYGDKEQAEQIRQKALEYVNKATF
ncbi:unnamed protein product [Leptosia nina]|uniref:rRNA biogenesis protein RRP5 n=1 Tax=Leptosia nina TaxID=320188 RepID=A0AAV1JHH3_9NEOP